jgi:hypothetical protein
VKNFERLSKKQRNNQATDQSGIVEFFFFLQKKSPTFFWTSRWLLGENEHCEGCKHQRLHGNKTLVCSSMIPPA